MKGPHVCSCLCALCERLGAGAFGLQPDGTPGVKVIRRRRVRRKVLPGIDSPGVQRHLARSAQ